MLYTNSLSRPFLKTKYIQWYHKSVFPFIMVSSSLKLATPLRLSHPKPTMWLATRQLEDLTKDKPGLHFQCALVLVLLSGWLRIASYIYAGLCRMTGTMLAGLARESYSPDAVAGGLVGYKMKKDVGPKLRNPRRRKESMRMALESR